MAAVRPKSRSRLVPAAETSAPAGPNRLMTQRRLSPADAVDRRDVAVNLAESPLAWLARRGLLVARQFEAGERLRADFMRAGHSPSVTMRWGGAPTGSGARGAPPAVDRLRRRE